MNHSALYVDGGVIGKNPSSVGGSWAARFIAGERVYLEKSDLIFATPDMPTISNNLTEMLALVSGLSFLPPKWTGTVYSDSLITLGRAFLGWKWSAIPPWLFKKFGQERKRLVNWEKIDHVLLAGHPTRAQLAEGIGRNGYPVSEHNVWCDHECSRIARAYMDKLLIEQFA